ncbi:hypothetical protein CEXT_589531 [Caerostris extrusa]|uniref:Uncharacterized protein n=1 Tax=Caerostris extrusa TaxID=172846 RepID=A0AAV4Q9T7_CAEEX|nr:hypothetical protein CEXT_589531 [Caerostris extrusa]
MPPSESSGMTAHMDQCRHFTEFRSLRSVTKTAVEGVNDVQNDDEKFSIHGELVETVRVTCLECPPCFDFTSPSDHRYRERDVLNARRPLVSVPRLWHPISLPRLIIKEVGKKAITDKEENPFPFIVAGFMGFYFLGSLVIYRKRCFRGGKSLGVEPQIYIRSPKLKAFSFNEDISEESISPSLRPSTPHSPNTPGRKGGWEAGRMFDANDSLIDYCTNSCFESSRHKSFLLLRVLPMERCVGRCLALATLCSGLW